MENKRLRMAKMNSLHQNISLYNLHTIFFYISQGADKEDWIIKKEFFWFMIISYILVTSMFVSGVIR